MYLVKVTSRFYIYISAEKAIKTIAHLATMVRMGLFQLYKYISEFDRYIYVRAAIDFYPSRGQVGKRDLTVVMGSWVRFPRRPSQHLKKKKIWLGFKVL